MSAKRKTTVGVIFGGHSVEHDVSVVTGHQVMQAFDPELYEVVPLSRGGVNRLQMFGVVLGYSQVVLYLEPHSGPERTLIPDTARARLFLAGEELPWSRWAACAALRGAMPR